MNLQFPNSTETLIKLNPAVWSDSVRALLRFKSLMGEIRELRGKWYQIRRDEKDDFSLPLEWWRMLAGGWEAFSYLFEASQKHKPGQPLKARRKCSECGTPVARPKNKYCSQKCSIAGQTMVRPKCKLSTCNNRVNKPEGKYCSMVCVNLSKRGPRITPHKRLMHWRKRRVLSNV